MSERDKRLAAKYTPIRVPKELAERLAEAAYKRRTSSVRLLAEILEQTLPQYE